MAVEELCASVVPQAACGDRTRVDRRSGHRAVKNTSFLKSRCGEGMRSGGPADGGHGGCHRQRQGPQRLGRHQLQQRPAAVPRGSTVAAAAGSQEIESGPTTRRPQFKQAPVTWLCCRAPQLTARPACLESTSITLCCLEHRGRDRCCLWWQPRGRKCKVCTRNVLGFSFRCLSLLIGCRADLEYRMLELRATPNKE